MPERKYLSVVFFSGGSQTLFKGASLRCRHSIQARSRPTTPLASPIVAFKTSSLNEFSNSRKDAGSKLMQSSLVTRFFPETPGDSCNWFLSSLSMNTYHFWTPCDLIAQKEKFNYSRFSFTGRHDICTSLAVLSHWGLQSNPVNTDTEGLQKVSVLTGCLYFAGWIERNARAFFQQGKSKLSVITRCR